MNGRELLDLQRKIDEGILLAQKRLACRARMDNLALVMYRGGEIVEMIPEEVENEETGRCGDPLSRTRYKAMNIER